MKKPKPPIENKIYAGIIGYCQSIEHKSYHGNGHHLAQRLTNLVSAALLPAQQKKIYDAMPYEENITTKQISALVNLPSKLVSAQLQQIQNSTLLIGKTRAQYGKFKVWRKYLVGNHIK